MDKDAAGYVGHIPRHVDQCPGPTKPPERSFLSLPSNPFEAFRALAYRPWSSKRSCPPVTAHLSRHRSGSKPAFAAIGCKPLAIANQFESLQLPTCIGEK